jgi:hypothetical protein
MFGMWEWVGDLKASQAGFLGTLTGSGLGLLALLIGALFNAHLNRERDDRLLEADRKAMVAALRAELMSIHRALEENAERLITHPPDHDGGFLTPDVMHQVQVLPHVLPKIGLLDVETIRKVTDAYTLMGQYLEGLVMLGGRVQTNMPEGRRVVYMEGTQAEIVSTYNHNRATMVLDAVDALGAIG